MESEEVEVRGKGAENGGLGFDQVCDSVEGVESLGDVELLDELDSYLEDIDGRLAISRMVSDAVTKGMVNGFQQEAAEEVAAKEFEVARLKESFCIRHVGNEENELARENIDLGECLNFMDVCVKRDKMGESLLMLRKDARDQFSTLKKEIGGIREHEIRSWAGLDRMVDNLERTMDLICSSVHSMLQFSTASVSEWKWEQDLKEELEVMVMRSSIRSQQEEFEMKMLDQQACLYDNQTVNWLEKFNEISGLRKELDAFVKLLPTPPDHGQLVSHASVDRDISQGVAGNHVPLRTPPWEGNGKADGSKTSVPENFDTAQLILMKSEDLVKHFNTAIFKMKREHESEVQHITEKYFFLKGKYLNDRGQVLPHTKGKEFDVLRQRIPEVIMKLDDILVDSEKLPTLGNDVTLGNLRNRLDNLLAENHQLRASLADKKHELECLSSQVSHSSEKILNYSLVESNLQTLIQNLSSSLEDAHIEAAIIEDVYTRALGELTDQIICTTEESGLQLSLIQDMYEVILREATIGAINTRNSEVEDADIESSIKQGMHEIILVQTLKNGERALKELSYRYLLADQNRVSLEVKVNEKEVRLRSEVEENKRLGEELMLLSNTLNEKERLVMEVLEEQNCLKEHASLQQELLSKANQEIDMLKGELVEAEQQIEACQMEIQSLNQKIEEVMKELREAGAHKNTVLALIQEKENCSSMLEAKEKEYMEQMKAMIPLVEELSEKIAILECQVGGDMEWNNLRLENSRSQLRSLTKKANALHKTKFHYKLRLEKRCADLQMAEAEVDLLGDEVDTLLSLLEKIYVALDHYSPVLQHYPGVVEILKMVRRELSVEPVKPVSTVQGIIEDTSM